MSDRLTPCRGLVVACLALVGCSVDETGYGDPDLGGSDSGLGAPDVTNDDVSSPGSEFDAPDLLYTARAPLGPEVVAVTVLALPGTFDALVDPVLRVQGRGGQASVALVDGGFVGVVDASLGDRVTLSDADGAVAAVVLTDPLDGIDTEADLGSPGSAPPLDDGDGAGGAASGAYVQVGAGSLALAPPYVAYVAAKGVVVQVGPADTDVRLPAEAGDEACVARVLGTRPSTASCWIVAGS